MISTAMNLSCSTSGSEPDHSSVVICWKKVQKAQFSFLVGWKADGTKRFLFIVIGNARETRFHNRKIVEELGHYYGIKKNSDELFLMDLMLKEHRRRILNSSINKTSC